MSSPALYPSFGALFEAQQGSTVSLYLELLNLADPHGTELAVSAIQRSLMLSPDSDAEIVALLEDVNWRSQLVGATAILIGGASDRTLAALWHAMDCGSWVSPQLAVTAFLADPDFELQARSRIEARCPLRTEKLESLGWLGRHTAAGPGSLEDHSAKLFSALIHLYKHQPMDDVARRWLDGILSEEANVNFLRSDDDQGDQIAADWLVEAKQIAARQS